MLTIATMYEAKDKSNLKEYANCNRVLLETIPTSDIANRDKLNVTKENIIPSVKKLKWYYYQPEAYNYKESNFSFSIARNIMLEHCETEWCLMLDSDEDVKVDNLVDTLKTFKSNIGRLSVYIASWEVVNNEIKMLASKTPRLFNVKSGIEFKNFVHEETTESLLKNKLNEGDIALLIEHNGYANPNIYNHKLIRNGGLLCKQIATNNEFNRIIYNYLYENTKEFIRLNNIPVPEIKDYTNIVNLAKDLNYYGIEIKVEMNKLIFNIENICNELQCNYNNQLQLVNLFVALKILNCLVNFNIPKRSPVELW